MALIDQQEVLDALNTQAEEMLHWHERYAEQRKGILTAVRIVSDIKPKRGKWEFRTVFPNDTSEFPMGYLVCSECGLKHPNKTPCNFCDNCGADMRGESE